MRAPFLGCCLCLSKNLVVSVALRHGKKVEEAAGLFGYRFTIGGEIVHGRKVGRTLNYPTANLVLADDLLAHGIYAVRFRRADGSLHDGVASYGRRPTFDDGAALFEDGTAELADDADVGDEEGEEGEEGEEDAD